MRLAAKLHAVLSDEHNWISSVDSAGCPGHDVAVLHTRIKARPAGLHYLRIVPGSHEAQHNRYLAAWFPARKRRPPDRPSAPDRIAGYLLVLRSMSTEVMSCARGAASTTSPLSAAQPRPNIAPPTKAETSMERFRLN